jgi:signal transduction histidine kinase
MVTLHLELDRTRRTLYAYLSDTNVSLASIPIGSRLRLEGAYKARTELGPDLDQTISGFEMFLNQPSDVVLLAHPAWWTPDRFLWAILVVSALLAVGLVWTLTIARKNKLLHEARDALEVAHQKLERRVEERTQELAYERDLLSSLLDNLPDLIYFKDLQSRFVRTSRSKLQWVSDLLRGRNCVEQNVNRGGTGISLEGKTAGQSGAPLGLADIEAGGNFLLGRTDFDFYPEERARAAFKDEQEIIRTGRPLVGKFEQTWGKAGEALWLLTTKMPWRDPAGNIIGTFGTSKDITAIKEAEAKLRNLHQQLLKTSRQAGMAEVATSVLHNVGNVLNSVNVSAGVISQKLRNSTIRRVAKLTELLEEHRHDLAEFLAQENRIEQLIAFVRNLDQELASEQAKLVSELSGLCSNIDRIKDIVARQQSYAKPSGLLEIESIPDLVEDTLRIHAAALALQPISVVRDFDTVPQILTDKHQVLQIFVNLIGNAAQAMASNQSQTAKLTIRVCRRAQEWISVSVSDNGIGIPPENLTRIFSHGFSTKKGGHGFGLHGGALAARELGGSLTVQSAGPNLGATFTLELPIRTENGPEPQKAAHTLPARLPTVTSPRNTAADSRQLLPKETPQKENAGAISCP